MRTCVSPDGTFQFGLHKPSYSVVNLRGKTRIEHLGADHNDTPINNARNYPCGDVEVAGADWIYEIANPLPFRGATFIGKSWADRSADDPERIRLAPRSTVSLTHTLAEQGIEPDILEHLPRPLLLSLATTSTDPEDLVRLAKLSGTFIFDEAGRPQGLRYRVDSTIGTRAEIADHDLFEAVANNPALPDCYKIAMVIRPGAQGTSEIVGDYHEGDSTHVYEYLRRNSYIGGGHYAANMADDAIRYDISSLQRSDFRGLRHLYYQRSYVRLAELLGIERHTPPLSADDLERYRIQIDRHPHLKRCEAAATLWGWNFGFDYAPSGYRLHASHQQIHQQYALIPDNIEGCRDGCSSPYCDYRPFACGDMISEVIGHYRQTHNRDFFRDYLRAIEQNKRMDARDDLEASLIVWEDERVMLFVPKAQTSQWELQVITKPVGKRQWPGNIVETDSPTRSSVDTALLKAQQALAERGAAMVTTIEFSKRFASTEHSQPLLYSLLPRLPESPGAMSEMQLRYIIGHYPEDFAAACRRSLT